LTFLNLSIKVAPKKVKKLFEDKGLELSTLADIVKITDPQGMIAEIEDHESNEKIVI
jgi:hypothetical protein